MPFYAGTYFPPEPRHGLPSWRMVLDAIAEAWHDKREQIDEQGAQLVETLGATARLEPSAEPIDEQAARPMRWRRCARTYDRVNGGFGGAPKFPPSSTIELLLARGEREMSLRTLRAMACGGIYDQVGGGFARYAVDATWTVPHFEKMLYDNALLARAYLHGWQVTGDERLRARLQRDARLGAARDARARGRLLLRARRRLRGRRGQVLRVDAGRAARRARRARRRAIEYFAAGAEFEGALRARGPRARARDAPGDPRKLYGARRSECGPGSTTSA